MGLARRRVYGAVRLKGSTNRVAVGLLARVASRASTEAKAHATALWAATGSCGGCAIENPVKTSE